MFVLRNTHIFYVVERKLFLAQTTVGDDFIIDPVQFLHTANILL